MPSNKQTMKVNILSTGRFHVCDLARELIRQGYDVRFYSYLPLHRTAQFGVPAAHCVSLAWAVGVWAWMERKAPWGRSAWTQVRQVLQDGLTSLLLRKADVTIAMSGEFVRSMQRARRDGGVIICERGSKHILDQKQILDANPNQRQSPISEGNVIREQLSYALADRIMTGAQHCRQTFINRGYPSECVMVNHYGVSLEAFHFTPDSARPYDLLMVGTWSYQKGCDLIMEVVRQTSLRLLHVGSLGDLPFPQGDTRFTHIDPVDERELVGYYSQARAFILPSRQDGLAMVLLQAMACGLPIISSVNNGASDLRDAFIEMGDSEGSRYVTIVESQGSDPTVDHLSRAVHQALTLTPRDYARRVFASFSWHAYGERYAANLQSIMEHPWRDSRTTPSHQNPHSHTALRILSVGSFNGNSNTSLHRHWALCRIAQSIDHVQTDLHPWNLCCRIRFRLFRWGLPIRLTENDAENERIRTLVDHNNYDLIWIDKGVTISAETLRYLKSRQPDCRIVSYSPDNMALRHNQSQQYLECLPLYDLVVTNKSYILDDLKQLGACRTLFVDNTFEPTFHRPLPIQGTPFEQLRDAVGFVGAWESDRCRSLCYLADHGVKVHVFGQGRWLDNQRYSANMIIEPRLLTDEEYCMALQGFGISLCFLRKLNLDRQTTRSVEIPACGGFMLAERTDEHQRLFKEGVEAAYFSSDEELLAQCRHYLSHPDERDRIAQAGRDHCLKSDYTHDAMVRRVIAELYEEKK